MRLSFGTQFKIEFFTTISKLNSRLSFLPPFTGGKKCLEFPQVIQFKGTQVTACWGSEVRMRNMAKCKLLHDRPEHLVFKGKTSSDENSDNETI